MNILAAEVGAAVEAAIAVSEVAATLVSPVVDAPTVTVPAVVESTVVAPSVVGPTATLETASPSGPALQPAPAGLDGVASPTVAQPPGQGAGAKPSLTNNQEKAHSIFDTARSLFQRGDFQLELAETNRAIALSPNETLMHEFRDLCLFATKVHQQAAAAIYAVLSIGLGLGHR